MVSEMCKQSEMCKHEIALHHAGFDLSEAKGQHRVICKYIIELLNDATDAIEIKHSKIASRRINSAIKLLKKEII